MSDLVKEAAPSLSPNTDSSNQAVNKRKLLALSSRGTSAGGFSGDQASLLGDAFAEVFASMAIASPMPIENADSAHEGSHAGEEAIEASDHSDETGQDDSQQNLADESVTRTQDAGANEFAVQAQVAQKVEAETGKEDDSILAGEVEQSDEAVDILDETESTEASQLEVASTISQSTNDFELDGQGDRSTTKEKESIDSKPVASAVGAEASKSTAEQKTTSGATQSDATEAVDLQSGEPIGPQTEDQPESGNRRRYSTDDGSANEKPAGNASEKSVSAAKPSTGALDQQSDSQSNLTLDSPATPTAARSVVPSATAAASANAAVAAATQSSGAASRGSLASGISASSGTAAGGARPAMGTEHAGRPEWASDSKSSKKPDAGTNNTDTLTRIKLVQRVSRAFQHLGPEGGVVRLRLAPAELGTVRVEMRIQQKKVNARVVAETDAASSALREHLPELRARLEAHGMQVESLEIETESGDTASSTLDHRSQEDPSRERPARPGRTGRRETGDTDRIVAAPVSRQPVSFASAGGVDIRF